MTSLFIFAFILLQLGRKRRQTSKISDKIGKECLVCGVNKVHLESKGGKWKDHVYEEHNFRKMLHFVIYLLDKPDFYCSDFEEKLKTMIIACDAEFFDSLANDQTGDSKRDEQQAARLESSTDRHV